MQNDIFNRQMQFCASGIALCRWHVETDGTILLVASSETNSVTQWENYILSLLIMKTRALAYFKVQILESYFLTYIQLLIC